MSSNITGGATVDLRKEHVTVFRVTILVSLALIMLSFKLFPTLDEKIPQAVVEETKFQEVYAVEDVPADAAPGLKGGNSSDKNAKISTGRVNKNSGGGAGKSGGGTTVNKGYSSNFNFDFKDSGIDEDGAYQQGGGTKNGGGGSGTGKGYGPGTGGGGKQPVETKPQVDMTFYAAVEIMPDAVGGQQGIQSRAGYPAAAKSAGIKGTVYVLAFINEYGQVVNARLMKGLGYGCDEAAINAVRQTLFTPGKKQGKAVKVQMAVPVSF